MYIYIYFNHTHRRSGSRD